MLVKTKGVVLHTIKYGDTSLIAQIYTESHGRQAFLVRGGRGKLSRHPARLLQPLYLLEMEVYYKASREIQHLKELKPHIIFQTIPHDIKKSTVSLFLGEVLSRTLREEEPNPDLFDFLQSSIQFYDLSIEGNSWFHLLFLAQLTKFLGFYPDNNYSAEKPYFDLLNGHFVPAVPLHPHYLSAGESGEMNRLLQAGFSTAMENYPQAGRRKDLLDDLIRYFRLHVEGMGEIRSYAVLRELYH